jgi:hypothetical protein
MPLFATSFFAERKTSQEENQPFYVYQNNEGRTIIFHHHLKAYSFACRFTR